jgi:hypothetical protein
MPIDVESRVRRLEDRVKIGEVVIKYAMGVDRRDWAMLAECFTDPVFTDYSELGSSAGMAPRTELVERIAAALSGFTATQHLSPNHVIEFDEGDPNRAVCYSYMFAQHLLEGGPSGDFYLLRGAYANYVLRTAEGWRIERLVQHLGWEEGNTNAVVEATQRWLASEKGS